MSRWRQLKGTDEYDRGDSPVPTVIIWIGVAAIAIGLVGWAAVYIQGLANQAPSTIPQPTIN
jgi:FlaG/FlaF family flagellin (archaellin)